MSGARLSRPASGVKLPCAHHGCTEYAPPGRVYCPEHDKRAGSTSEWRRLRARIIKRQGGRCAECGVSRNLEVHHRDGDPSNDAEYNLLALCHRCHAG